MSERQRPPLGRRLIDVTEAQQVYFTRAQAHRQGVDDSALERGVASGAIERLDYGVYRIGGWGYDPHQRLRVAWLRLTPDLSPRERTVRPHLWVSHRSAAALFDLGSRNLADCAGVHLRSASPVSSRREDTGADRRAGP